MSSKEPEMPDEASEELKDELRRQLVWLIRFLERWPNFRKHAALGLLGAAIATTDTMGVDAEGFLRGLRERCPKPQPLAPGPKVAS